VDVVHARLASRPLRTHSHSIAYARIPADLDEYFACCPPGAQQALRQMRAAIRKAVPDSEEKIRYGMPSFT